MNEYPVINFIIFFQSPDSTNLYYTNQNWWLVGLCDLLILSKCLKTFVLSQMEQTERQQYERKREDAHQLTSVQFFITQHKEMDAQGNQAKQSLPNGKGNCVYVL